MQVAATTGRSLWPGRAPQRRVAAGVSPSAGFLASLFPGAQPHRHRAGGGCPGVSISVHTPSRGLNTGVLKEEELITIKR